MSKKALIHIGTGKTGTTSIQESLSTQKKKLAGIGYPNVVGNAHHFLEVIYNERYRLARGHRSVYKDEASRLKDAQVLKSKFLKRLRNSKGVIISSEFLSKFEVSKIYLLKKDLEEAGYTLFEIVCYVRNPVSYYRSVLQQSLRASHLPPHPEHFRYGVRETIENYRAVFGDHVVVRAFDDGLYDDDVVQDFVKQVEQFFGVEIAGIESKSKNHSLSAEALFILQRFREFYDFDKDSVLTPKSALLLDYLEGLPEAETTSIKLNRGVEELIQRRFEDEVLWIRENCGIDFHMAPSGLERHGESRKLDYQKLENIIRKPYKSLERVKFEIIDKFLGMYEPVNSKSLRRRVFKKQY